MTDAEAIATLRALAADMERTHEQRIAALRGAIVLEAAVQRAERERRVRVTARALRDAGEA